MRKRKVKIAALAMAATMAVSLAACGNEGSGGGSSSGSGSSSQANSSLQNNSDNDKVITYWNIGTEGADKQALEYAIDEFNKNTKSGYTVLNIPTQNDNYKEKLVVAMRLRRMPRYVYKLVWRTNERIHKVWICTAFG